MKINKLLYMKLLVSLTLLFGFSSNPDIHEIRKMYPTVANSKITSKEFSSKLAGVTNDENKTLVAYKGASIIVESRFIKKVSDKMTHFKEGVKLIEFAVKKEPNTLEIRLIRLSIQENTPKIVKYRKNIEEDKNFILTHYKDQSRDFKVYLKNFIMQSKSFSASEKQTIE